MGTKQVILHNEKIFKLQNEYLQIILHAQRSETLTLRY